MGLLVLAAHLKYFICWFYFVDTPCFRTFSTSLDILFPTFLSWLLYYFICLLYSIFNIRHRLVLFWRMSLFVFYRFIVRCLRYLFVQPVLVLTWIKLSRLKFLSVNIAISSCRWLTSPFVFLHSKGNIIFALVK